MTLGKMTSLDEYKKLLTECSGDLDQYMVGTELNITANESKELIDNFKKFIRCIYKELKEIESEKFWIEISKIDSKNKKFQSWLRKNIEKELKPYKETEFIRRLEQKEFEILVKYCLDNLVLEFIGVKNIKSPIEKISIDEVIVCNKVLYTFIKLRVFYNNSKDLAFDKMKNMFGLSDEKCVFCWEKIISNENKLWKIIITREIEQIRKNQKDE